MKFSKQQIQLILLALLVVGGGGWYYLAKLYSPVVMAVKENKKLLEEKRSQVVKLLYVEDEFKREREDLERKRLELEGVEDMLPKEKEIPDLLKSITKTAEANAIDFLSFTPQGIIPRDLYDELPIDITLKVGYHGLGKFLNELGHLYRIVVPSIKSMTGREPIKEDPYTIDVFLTISTFVYK